MSCKKFLKELLVGAFQKSLICKTLKQWAPRSGRIVEHLSGLRILCGCEQMTQNKVVVRAIGRGFAKIPYLLKT